MSVQNSFKNPTENFPKFSSYCVCPRHSQTMDMAATVILFAELPELQFHYDFTIDSLYIIATCCFRLYFFFSRDFAAPLFSPLFDLTTAFLATPLYMAHPKAPPVSPLTSPLQVVPFLSSDGVPSKIVDSSSSSSSAPNDGYNLADLDIWRMGSFHQNPFRGAIQPADCSIQCGPLLALL